MTEKIVLDNLNPNSVSLLKISVITVDGQEIEASRWRRAYVNSTAGRAAVAAEVADPYKTAIMAVWGDNPTVTDAA